MQNTSETYLRIKKLNYFGSSYLKVNMKYNIMVNSQLSYYMIIENGSKTAYIWFQNTL